MRSIAAVLFLLCLAWSQAFAAECPVFPGAGGDAAAHHQVPAGHGHGGHGTHAPPSGDHGRHSPDAACPMATACGIVAAPTQEGAPSLPDLPKTTSFVAPSGSHASPDLGFDPPPPRPS